MAHRAGILAAGNLLVDHVLMIPHYPEQGALATMEHVSRCVGGAPLNVLITLAKMINHSSPNALPLATFGMMDEDDNGDYIRRQLSIHHIEDLTVTAANFSHKTAYSYVMNAQDTGQRTFFHELGANALLNIHHFEPLNTSHKIFHLGYLLLLDGLDQIDQIFGSVSAKLFHQMQQKGYKTALDLVSIKAPEKFQSLIAPCLPYINYLIINEWEAEQLSGITIRNQDQSVSAIFMRNAAQCLIKKGVNDIVVIHCPEGAVAVTHDLIEYECPSYPILVQDIQGTVGAGDAFCAGMLYALHESLPIEQALKIANGCAYFNLHSANSVDGSVDLNALLHFIHNTKTRSEFKI